MSNDPVFELNHVKALWALSEITSVRTSKFYRDELADIRSKALASSTLTLESLDQNECERLVQAFESARGRFLSDYLKNVLRFALCNLSKDELKDLYAMSNMNKGYFIRLRDYCAAIPLDADPSDPRVVATKIVEPIWLKYPATVGIYGDLRVLIDGYARTLVFLRAAQDEGRLQVFVPSSSTRRGELHDLPPSGCADDGCMAE
jgi:hypothetical protein